MHQYSKRSTGPKAPLYAITARKIEVRAAADGQGTSRTLKGYAVVFNAASEPMYDVTEYIAPGAFAQSLKDNPDVRALFNHEDEMVLGRTTSGTLRLGEDATGLWFEIDLPNTTAGNDVLELVKRGDVSGMSFGFCCVEENWKDNLDGTFTRTVLQAELIEISVVTFPAYPDTFVSVRAKVPENLKKPEPKPEPKADDEQRRQRDRLAILIAMSAGSRFPIPT